MQVRVECRLQQPTLQSRKKAKISSEKDKGTGTGAISDSDDEEPEAVRISNVVVATLRSKTFK